MNKEHKENNSLANKELEPGLNIRSVSSYKVSPSNVKFGSIGAFKLLSATVQVILGTAVIILSAIELINPSWLATVISILGSISVISGLFAGYNLFSRRENFNFLINRAIKRVITFQN
ncbi:MAG: hypothetical protein ABJR05_11835 [Balneola sp.]